MAFGLRPFFGMLWSIAPTAFGLRVAPLDASGGAFLLKKTGWSASASAKYQKHNVTRKVVPLYPTDSDLKEWLESRDEPFATYVKRLIREDMARSGE